MDLEDVSAFRNLSSFGEFNINNCSWNLKPAARVSAGFTE